MTTNEALAEEILAHALTLERLTAGERRVLLRVLAALERELVERLQSASLTAWSSARLTRLLTQIQPLVRDAYRTLRDRHAERLQEVARLEAHWTVQSLNAALSRPLDVVLDLAAPLGAEETLRALARSVLIDGAASATWWARQAADLRRRFQTALRLGLLAGDTTEQLVRRVRGTAALGFTDGVMAVSRRQAEALVRSSVSAVAQTARLETYRQQHDLVRALQWRSTLDARTTIDYCVPRANRLYTLDGQPLGHLLPWNGGPGVIHWNCRSQVTPVLRSWEELAGRPLPQFNQRTLQARFRQQLRARGWDDARIAAAHRRMQASMSGEVPAELDVFAWLRRQPHAVQDSLLGPGRAALFRRGLLRDVSQLVDVTGAPLSLQELRLRLGLAP